MKDPKRNVSETLDFEPREEGASRGDGGGKAVRVLVDGGEGSHRAHGVAEHVNPVGVDLMLLGEFRIDEFENLIEHAVGGLVRAVGFLDAGDNLGAELAHAFGQVVGGECAGLGVHIDVRGVVEPGAVRLRHQHKAGVFAAKFFVRQVLVPDEDILGVLRTASAATMQAENQRIGLLRIEVDGFHQAIRNALELAWLVEGEGLRRDGRGSISRNGKTRRRQQSEDHEAQNGLLFIHRLLFLNNR